MTHPIQPIPSIQIPFIERFKVHYPEQWQRLQAQPLNDFLQPSANDYQNWLDDEIERLSTEFPEKTTLSSLIACVRQSFAVKLALADLQHELDIVQSSRYLSHFAEGCLLFIVQHVYQQLTKKHGIPQTQQQDNIQNEIQDERPDEKQDKEQDEVHLSLLAMGKLGANELNFSSDVDLIFIYSEEGETDISQAQSRRSLSNQQFYSRLVKEVGEFCQPLNKNELIFRIDNRLRPFGSASPLAISFPFLRNYLQGHARDWERLAYAKARPMGISENFNEQLTALITPFVYRRYTDFGLYESIRIMRDKIAANVTRAHSQRNIKLGFGGIRCLEFCIQVLQMNLCRKYPQLHTRGSFKILQLLLNLPEPLVEIQQMEQNLLFLRQLEQRLQIWDDAQTHNLPDEEDLTQWQWLTASFDNINSTNAFKQQIEQVRHQVEQSFQDVLPSTPDAKQGQLFDANITELDIADMISDMPVALQSNFIENCFTFVQSVRFQQANDQAKERFSSLMTAVIEQTRQLDSTQVAQPKWDDFFSLLDKIIRRSVYISLLIEYPMVLERVLHWNFYQPWLIEQCRNYPTLLENAIETSQWKQQILPANLTEQWKNLCRQSYSLDWFMDKLREHRRSAIVKVAALVQQGTIGSYQSSDYLTNIATHIGKQGLMLALRDLRPKWQDKIDLDWNNPPILIIAYGKMGSFELGFDSDLDIVILFDDSSQHETHNQIPFFMKLVQRWRHILNTTTPAGKCYDIDFRLRPDGTKGLLVTGINQYATYLKERAWMWEKRALIRARAVIGQRQLAEHFWNIRKSILTQPIPKETLQQEILSMRKQVSEQYPTSPKTFDIKHDSGGIMDLEFLVQYLYLLTVPKHTQLLRNRSVSTILSNMQRLDIHLADNQQLTNVYLQYRSTIHQQFLQNVPKSSQVAPDQLTEQRQIVQQHWQRLLNTTS